jgi:CBS domain-containing protein
MQENDMTLVSDILERKGGRVVVASADDTVLRAARLMNEERIGSVVVVAPGQTVVGIMTERDILRRVVVECQRPEAVKVGEVMSKPVTCCRLSTSLLECQEVMTNKRLRHLPVVENDELVGIISIGDILAKEVELQQSTIEYLNEYLHGRA